MHGVGRVIDYQPGSVPVGVGRQGYVDAALVDLYVDVYPSVLVFQTK